MPRAAFYLASGAAVASLVSIAACQILLGAAFLAVLLSRWRLRLPPIYVPLGCFVALTVLSLLLSTDPRAGLPQLRKLYVYLMLPVVFTAITRVTDIRRLVWLWAAAATGSACWAFFQFWTKWQHAAAEHRDFYNAYVADRVTGFLGLWMTFGAAQMIALVLAVAVLLFAPPRRYRWLVILAVALILFSIVIGWTRSVWLGTGLSMGYLVATWRARLLLLAPILLVIGWAVAPDSLRERVTSIYRPHGEVDSNQHRYVTARTGIAMIQAHPWFGLGPEMPGKRFLEYVPPDIRRPLPVGFYGHLHNVYLQYAAERGLPALAVFLWLIATVFLHWGQRVRKTTDPYRRAILHGSIAALIALLVEGFFEHNLGDSEVLSMFWLVVAWGYRAWEADA